ncbi:MAG: class I adenylate-forming enzyme family protein [Kofleriaceae bacterium]
MHGRLDQLVQHWAQRASTKAALLFPDSHPSVSYGDLERRASAFARVLQQRGIAPGTAVLLANANTAGFFAALFGASRAGCVAVPIDTNLAPPEIQAIAKHAGAGFAVVEPDSAAKVIAAIGAVPCVILGGDSIDGATAVDLDAPHELPAPAPVDPEDLALILYTSGTTGVPKGVMHSHATLLAKVSTITDWFGFDDSFRSLCLLPTHFGHGLICNCLSTLFYGGSLVLCRPFDFQLVTRLTKILEDFQVSTFSTVPAVVRTLMLVLDRRPRVTLPALRFVTCASSTLTTDDIEPFEEKLGVPLLNCYGITETASWTAFSPRDPARPKESVGKAFNCEIRAVDPATRQPVAAGVEGELQVKGPSVMLGYLKLPELTATVLQDGWFSTGDIGRVDPNGHVYLMSRIKDIIIRAGLNVYPAEVDQVLLRHPGIADAVCVGIEDPLLGERVVACVVRRPGSEVGERDLIDHCKQFLAPYKCPDRIRFVEEIKKTARGKVNRANLRPLFSE